MDTRRQITSYPLDDTIVTVSTQHSSRKQRRKSHTYTIPKLLLVWLDGNIDLENNNESKETISRFQKIISTIIPFTTIDECVCFIKNTSQDQIFMIASGSLGQIIVPLVHDLPQISIIYIFCGNQAHHEQWAKHWSKIKGVVIDIAPICNALKQAVSQSNQSSMSISFINTMHTTVKQCLNKFDSLFIYTYVIKNIILTGNFDQDHFNDFIAYCSEIFMENPEELQSVDKLAHGYRRHPPIWWYTHQNFLYSMLNQSLNTMDVSLMIKMGFFIQDLSNNIVELHKEQYVDNVHSKSFTVYHSQGLSLTNLDNLLKTENGFLSFNNFLSASSDHASSLDFVQKMITSSDLVGVLFLIRIDTSKTSTPFANIAEVSYIKEEKVLFSMQSIFRINKIERMGNNRLWQVDLTLIDDNDPEINTFIQQIREETYSDVKEWNRLGMLLIKMEDFSKAQELYDTLLDQTMSDQKKADIYQQLGLIKENQREYQNAIEYYEQAKEILERYVPSMDASFSACYGNIGFAYDKMGDYANALAYHQKALKIDQCILPSDHPDLASSYNNIGFVYDNMGDYSNALTYHQKALEIYEKVLPSNHPDLATSYNNIGWVYRNMGYYSKALSFYERALDILQRSLPSDHPNLRDIRKSINVVKKKI